MGVDTLRKGDTEESNNSNNNNNNNNNLPISYDY
jgi:hypothetical protein